MHHLREPEEFGLAVSGASLAADFLAPQKLPTRVEQFQAPTWALDFHEAHVKARIAGPLPPGWVSFGLMRSPAPSSWYGQTTGAGVLVCTPPGSGIDGRITPGFTCTSLNVPVAVWEQCREVAGQSGRQMGSGAVLHLPPALFAEIERQIEGSRRALRQNTAGAATEAAALTREIIIRAWELLDENEPERTQSYRNRARLVRHAEQWMRDHLAAPIHIPDACTALRVSRRELEYAFRTVLDESPRDYLQSLRLNAIRRALIRSGERLNLTDIALTHGITHASRFSAQYRALFGEYPSETQKAAR